MNNIGIEGLHQKFRLPKNISFNNTIICLILFFSLGYVYIGNIGFISYLITVPFLFKAKVSTSDLILVYLLVFLLFANMLFGDPINILIVSRYFIGFTVFYLFTRYQVIQINIEALLVFLSIFTLLEALLINTFVGRDLLPNYQANITDGAFEGPYFGFYLRPMSFGGNASVTSGILVSLLAFIKPRKIITYFIVTIAVISSMSGTGFLLLFLYTLYSNFKVGVIISTILLVYTNVHLYSGSIFSKGDPRYLLEMVYYKISSNFEPLSDVSILLFGGIHKHNYVLDYGGDFAMLSLVLSLGLITSSIVMFFIFRRINRENALAIILILIGSCHYGVIFSLSGQVIMALLLTQNLSKRPYLIEYKGKEG